MFTKQELKTNLLGSFEILLFMRSGVERFSTTRESAIKSLIIPALMLPFTLAVVVAIAQHPVSIFMIMLDAIQIILSIGLFFTAVYFLSKNYDKQESFYRFVTMINWFTLIALGFLIPIFVAMLNGADMEALKSYAVFITLLGYIYYGFIVTHSFRIPWELGGFMGVVALAIDQNLYQLVGYISQSMPV